MGSVFSTLYLCSDSSDFKSTQFGFRILYFLSLKRKKIQQLNCSVATVWVSYFVLFFFEKKKFQKLYCSVARAVVSSSFLRNAAAALSGDQLKRSRMFFLFFVYLVGHQNSVALKCFLIVDDEDTKLESNCLKNSSAPSSSKCRVDDCEGFDSFSYLNVDVKVRHLEIWCSCFMRWS